MFHFCFNIQLFPLPFSNSRAPLAAVLKDWVAGGKEVLKSWHSVAIQDSECGWVGSWGNCCLTEFQKDLVNLILCLTLSNGRHSNKPHCSWWIKCIAFWATQLGGWDLARVRNCLPKSFRVLSAWRRVECSRWRRSYKGIAETRQRRAKTPALASSATMSFSEVPYAI